jgi:hypothetical protein
MANPRHQERSFESTAEQVERKLGERRLMHRETLQI